MASDPALVPGFGAAGLWRTGGGKVPSLGGGGPQEGVFCGGRCVTKKGESISGGMAGYTFQSQPARPIRVIFRLSGPGHEREARPVDKHSSPAALSGACISEELALAGA